MSQVIAAVESAEESAEESVALRPMERLQPPAVQCEPGFQLLVESLANGASSAARTAADLPVLEVPAGVTHLVPSRDPLALASRKPRTPALVLEPLRVGERSRLLLLTPTSLRARLNGQAVPLVALLKVGDQLQLDARAILHVTEYRSAGAVTPSPDLVGSLCAICRVPLTAKTTVYMCGGCGLPFHLEGPPKPVDDRLECALFGDCPACETAVRTESGLVWLPEL